eukprot:2472798-Prymnesium_polylepis.1
MVWCASTAHLRERVRRYVGVLWTHHLLHVFRPIRPPRRNAAALAHLLDERLAHALGHAVGVLGDDPEKQPRQRGLLHARLSGDEAPPF